MKKLITSLNAMLLSLLLLSGCAIQIKELPPDPTKEYPPTTTANTEAFDTAPVTSSDTAYITLNGNLPAFTDAEITTDSFETYSELDPLDRCGTAIACVGTDLMPTEKRGNISRIKPTGWHSDRYESVEGGNLYNRCHLIAYQLSGENANEKNLITGTRYMNVQMIPFEEMVADYVKETGNHVMYRVTPVFHEDNLIASGVQMEALSVEDHGEGISYNVYLYNIQPGIQIDYATGDSHEKADTESENDSGSYYIININTLKFHLPSCSSVEKIQDENKEKSHDTRETLIEKGYTPCGTCQP